MKQNKNRGLWLAGTVCAALAAIACLIVEYGYEKIILPRGYQWMYPWMRDGSIGPGSGFYGTCGALSASGVGQKENNGDRVRYRCRHRSRCLQRTV